MTNTIRPPRFAGWLLSLFVAKNQIPPILGDLREEFAAIAAQKGSRSARLWYWRQAAKTIPHLFFAQLVQEPWQTLVTLLAGLLILWAANLPMIIVDQYYPDWPEPLRLAWLVCFPIVALVLPPMLSGWIVASASRHRGMVPTLLFAVTVVALLLTCNYSYSVHVRAPGGALGPPPVWSLFWLGIDIQTTMVVWPIAAFLGGLIARKMARRAAVCPERAD